MDFEDDDDEGSSGLSSRPGTSGSARSRSKSAKSSRAESARDRAESARSKGGAGRSSSSAKASHALSRQGSARSQKSVAWSTNADHQHLLEDDPTKKQNWCTRIISGMWASREMLVNNKDQQLYVKTTLRELILYCIFMFVIIYQTFAQYSPMYNTFTSAMQGLFVHQPAVTSMPLFWHFMDTDVMSGLYWESWYNNGTFRPDMSCPDGTPNTAPCNVPPADRNILYQNRILGLPRIRQLKVKNDSCNIQADFKRAIKVCYAPYDPAYEDTQRFVPAFRNYTDDTAWTYSTQEALAGTSHWGQLATYSGAGYVQNFHYLQADTQNIVNELMSNLWLDQGTRFVIIDFTVYNANVNLFCVVKLTFEFPATGGVVNDQEFTTVRLFRYTDNIDYFLLACEICFALFILYYIVEECLELKAHRFNYFFNVWNILDLVVIGISATQIFYMVYNDLSIGGLVSTLLKKPFQYADFAPLSSRARTLKTLSALNIFVAWIKLFKYLSFNKTMTQLSETLSAAAGDLSGFSVMFFIIYFAFVQLGYLLFGTQCHDFRSFMDSVYTLFRMILGDFNFRDIERANTFLGPLYFLSYIFFIFFVLLNVFLAIIVDTFGNVKAELKRRKPDFQMSDFFKTGTNNVKSYVGIHDRAVDVENAIKLAAADDGFVTYEELREHLRKARFSDTEIDLFFYHFQRDPVISQMILDDEAVKAKLVRQEKRRLSTIFDVVDDDDLGFGSDDDDEDSENRKPKSGKEARMARSARIKSALKKEEDMVADVDFYNLQRRVDRMEHSIAPLASRIDLVLAKLGAEVRKFTKSDMEKMFDHIIKSDDVNATYAKYMEY